MADDLSIVGPLTDRIEVGHDQYQNYLMDHTLAFAFVLSCNSVIESPTQKGGKFSASIRFSF